MKTSHILIGGAVIAVGAYVLINRGKRSEATAAATAPASSSSSSDSKPSTGIRILGALGSAFSSYSQSGTTVYRSTKPTSLAAVKALDLGDLDVVDMHVV